MNIAPIKRSKLCSAKSITKQAERSIEKKTGLRVNLIAYRDSHIARTPEKMMNIIAGSLGMDRTHYTLRSRERDVVELRFLAAYFLRSYFPTITLHQISMFFGGVDHTSVMNGLARANMLLEMEDQRFSHKYETVLRSVNQWLRKETSGYASAICA